MEVVENNKETKETPKKPSYEELNDYCNQLMMQNRQLGQRLNQVMNVQNKLPYLFEIIKNKEFFDKDYLGATVKEITMILPPYSEEETKEETEPSNKD